VRQPSEAGLASRIAVSSFLFPVCKVGCGGLGPLPSHIIVKTIVAALTMVFRK
jgi:hypothetical protein